MVVIFFGSDFDTNGQEVIPLEYEAVGNFSEGLAAVAAVKKNGKVLVDYWNPEEYN
ncbi:MAG: WG repeat-containing protein [Peptococcaceae bacterium]|nr:WG repeat-containing protein [Peptococcaceae bacterium]